MLGYSRFCNGPDPSQQSPEAGRPHCTTGTTVVSTPMLTGCLTAARCRLVTGRRNARPRRGRQDAPNRTATIRLRSAWNILSDSTFRDDHVDVRPMGPLATRQAPAKSPVAVISVRSHATRGVAPHDSFGVDTAAWWPILVCLVHR